MMLRRLLFVALFAVGGCIGSSVPRNPMTPKSVALVTSSSVSKVDSTTVAPVESPTPTLNKKVY